jgi:uncharacterized protein
MVLLLPVNHDTSAPPATPAGSDRLINAGMLFTSGRSPGMNVRLARVWAKDEPFGTEFAEVMLAGSILSATGVAIGTEPSPYRLEYDLHTGDQFITRRLEVRSSGAGWRRALILHRSPAGEWSCATEAEGDLDLAPPGGDLASLTGALDCDLGLSPLTNSMPVLRHGLLAGGGPVDLVMAWVAVPQLTLSASPQRYTFARRERNRSVVRFESLDSDFHAEIAFDQHGLVLDYPGIAHLVT